jgi:hypothetical protein
MGLVIAAGGGDSHDSSSVILWDSYLIAFVIPMMQFQSDLKECVEFRGIFHLQFLSLCKGLGFRVLCQGLFFLQNIHFLCPKTWLEFPSVLGGQVMKRNISFC